MRLLPPIPARYEPEVTRCLDDLVRRCALDAALRDDSPLPNGLLEDAAIDATRDGVIYLGVATLPDDAAVTLTDMQQTLRRIA